MANFNTKQYLDLAGLKAFWGIIKDKFVSNVTLTMGETGAVLEGSFGDGDKLTIGTIPMATSTQAGLMSAAQAKTVAEFSDGVNVLVPLTDVKVAGTSATLDGRAVNLDFIYDSTAKEIQVVDRNKVVNEKPAVLTKIDATAFIKDGMVQSVSFNAETNDLEIVFNQDGPTEPIIIPLDKLIDVYAAGDGIDIKDGNLITVKTNSDYLSADVNGLKVTDALWDEVNRLDKAVADAAAADAKTKAETAQAAAKDYTDAQIGGPLAEGVTVLKKIEAAENKAATELATAVGNYSVKGEDGSVTTPASGLKGEIEAAEARAAADATTKANAAEGNAKGYVDQEIAKVVGDGGTLAGTLAAAKTYTDEEIAKVDAVIGKAAEGEGETATAATGLYKYIDDADAKVLVDAKAYADGLAEDYDEAGAAAGVKDYADKTFVKLDGYVAYTGEEKTKLAGIAEGAQVNVIEAVKVNGVTATITDKTAEVTVDCYTEKEVDDKLAAINTKIGDVPGDKDVVTMISDAETSAKGYADSLYNNIVAISLDDITIEKLNA